MNMFGYETMTTFWEDFSIAERFGVDAVKDTYERAYEEWRSDYKYLTELVMVLNWKLWFHHEEGNHVLAEVYNDLWSQADEYACENLEGNELTYFFETTD